MKNKINILMLVGVVFVTLSGCIKNEEIIITRNEVEIDWASYHARTSGYPFTLMLRVPREPGRAQLAADPLLSRTFADTIRMRINLTGPQLPTAQTFEMRVDPSYTTGIEGAAGAPGAHFQLIDRTVTIPANSSFGFCRWVVRNPGQANVIPITVSFRLVGNAQIKVAENYQYIGWSIPQD
jgi:hypothetical protein